MKTFVQNVKCSVISSVFSKENNWLCSWVGSQWGISCCSVAHLSTPEGLDLSSTDMMHVIIKNVQQFVRWLLPSLFHMFSYFCPFFLHLQSIFSVSMHLILHHAFWGFFDLNFFLSFFSFPPLLLSSLVSLYCLWERRREVSHPGHAWAKWRGVSLRCEITITPWLSWLDSMNIWKAKPNYWLNIYWWFPSWQTVRWYHISHMTDCTVLQHATHIRAVIMLLLPSPLIMF